MSADSDNVTYDNDGRSGSDPVDSAEQSGGSNSRHDAWIHPSPSTGRIRRSVDRLPDIAETDAERSPVQTAGHSGHVFTVHTHTHTPHATLLSRLNLGCHINCSEAWRPKPRIRERRIKGKGPVLDIALLHDEHTLRSTLQSRKWQLIGMS